MALDALAAVTVQDVTEADLWSITRCNCSPRSIAIKAILTDEHSALFRRFLWPLPDSQQYGKKPKGR